MHARVLKKIGTPLESVDRDNPQPGPGEIRVTVSACGVCRTDLHVVDGELPDPKVSIIPGHARPPRTHSLARMMPSPISALAGSRGPPCSFRDGYGLRQHWPHHAPRR